MNDQSNGRGIFYGVIGVATLIVAIIGATFAYFTASISANEGSDAIAGGTNDNIAGAMSLVVTRLYPAAGESGGTGVNGLVPSDITNTAESITDAVSASCVDEGYVGCHVYKITASSTNAVSSASIMLDTLTVSAATTTDWNYAVYSGTDASATSVIKSGAIAGYATTNTTASSKDIHGGASLTAGSPVTYYLIIYLQDNSSVQNDATSGTNQTGTYSGTVTMNAAGGQVSATFASS